MKINKYPLNYNSKKVAYLSEWKKCNNLCICRQSSTKILHGVK